MLGRPETRVKGAAGIEHDKVLRSQKNDDSATRQEVPGNARRLTGRERECCNAGSAPQRVDEEKRAMFELMMRTICGCRLEETVTRKQEAAPG